MIVRMIQDQRKKMEAKIEKVQEIVYQRPRRTKEQTEINNNTRRNQ